MIKRIVLTAASVVALTAAANAADMYRAPAGGYKDGPVYAGVNWSGFYIGANGGYGWSDNNSNNYYYYYGDTQPSGGFGGGQIGYNWQGVWNPNLVLGIEADIQGADISDTTLVGDGRNGYANIEARVNWFGTVRGRIGYAFDNALLYATGGFAFGEVENKAGYLSATSTETGYTVGGGIEYKINPSWSVKAEYQFISLDAGHSDPSLTADGNSDFHTFRAGINYHFGNVYAPLK